MTYHPFINCAAYSTRTLLKRLSDLEESEACAHRPNASPNRIREKTRIEAALVQRRALSTRIYPSRMNTR